VAQLAGDRTAHASATATLAATLAAISADGADHGLRLLRASLAATDGWTPPPPLEEGLAAMPARLLAMKGDLDGASAALEQAANGSDGQPQLAVVRARVLLSSGDPWHAAAVLEPLLDRSGDFAYYSMFLEAHLLDSIALHETRERERASASLERTLDLAAPNRFRRLFVGAGPVMRTMLVEHARGGTHQRAFVGELLAAFERRAPEVERTQVQLLEPLSAREQAILRYLPTLMSNQEIAGELFVSVNTVKTHLRSIYRKLGAARRREAVETARRLELL
jgi:LuxR family maltose regulon positive regulatory protein